MASYAVGDIQGCRVEFEQLLDEIAFDPARDALWLVGDLVNRGPDSLGVLRMVRALHARMGERLICVLGNHDLHLLACARGAHERLRPGDTLDEVLAAPDRDALLGWLRARPLLHHDAGLGYTMVHAGLPPDWDLATARQAAGEVQAWLSGPDYRGLLDAMYGNKPARWSGDLDRLERCRYTINALTRLRFCHQDGRLDFAFKGDLLQAGSTLVAWFDFPARRSRELRVIFGHWSTLRLSPAAQAARGAYHLDTGCVWGGALTALRLDDGAYFQVQSQTRAAFD